VRLMTKDWLYSLFYTSSKTFNKVFLDCFETTDILFRLRFLRASRIPTRFRHSLDLRPPKSRWCQISRKETSASLWRAHLCRSYQLHQIFRPHASNGHCRASNSRSCECRSTSRTTPPFNRKVRALSAHGGQSFHPEIPNLWKNVKTLRSAKASVDKLLKGELLTSETGPIWVPEFSTPAGRRFLSSLNIDRKLVVFCDPRRRTLTVYGQADARERVKLEIQNHIKEIALHRHLIPLDNGDLATLLRGGLQTLRSRFGEGNIHFDIIAKTVEVNGSALDLEEASGLMKKARSSQQLAANITDSPDCPICYCDVENPVSFKCGHSYCQGCFDLYVESSLGSRSAPLSCATCNTKIDLSILRPLQSFDELLSIAFANYVSSNPTLYSYCPTPDCPQIYQIGSAGTVVQCSECLTHICTFCKIEWHEGMSCEEVQEDRDPTSQEKKNVQLMSELGIKPCPRCKTLIEKIAGCNHVTCSGCKTHLCWVCLRDFGDHGGSAVYDHMRKVHGTIG
jgi:IBR domain, a half RING-finger domain/IBR domain/RING-type zinc-finger